MWAPLPVGVTDPEAVLSEVAEAMRGIKESGQAVGAVALTSLADFAPPTIMSQAARLQARQRFFNLVVTNVPGPQIPLYLLGRRMIRFYLSSRWPCRALGIAIMSYDGRLAFGPGRLRRDGRPGPTTCAWRSTISPTRRRPARGSEPQAGRASAPRRSPAHSSAR
jgi:hypothetical protein